MKTARVIIQSGTFIKKEYVFQYTDLEDFKTGLLKRFGNIDGTRNGNTHRQVVKDLIKNAASMEAIAAIDDYGWSVSIDVREKK